MSTITTTIRWQPDELALIKTMAKRIGLPVALYIKSFALKNANEEMAKEQSSYSPALIEELYQSQQEALDGKNVDQYKDSQDFMKTLSAHHNKKA